MPQSLSQIYVHLVFSTKDRKPWLCDDIMRDQLHSYMATVLRDNVDSPALVINSVEHHQRVSFKDEFRELCRRHGLTLDERYVWD